MIDRCYDFVEQAKREGRRVVGILCEYTPRELIMAAGAVPVCVCMYIPVSILKQIAKNNLNAYKM